jgi:hypothetical protein
MKDIVHDQWGNEIYLTDERWQHIISRHPDKTGCRQQLLLTIRTGQRREVAIGSNKYQYWKKFHHLRPGKKRIRAIVQFETKKSGTSLLPNNFVVTAYQI